MTIRSLACAGGLREWRKSSRSAAYGQIKASRRSAKIFAAPLVGLTAAVGGSFFHSRTLSIKSLNFKNLWSRVAIFATSIQSTTAN
jgi:uncharacterized membrane protein YeiH